MHQRGVVQPLPACRAEVHLFADVAGVLRDPLDVTGGVAVLRLERANQHVHGLVVRFGDAHVGTKHLPPDEDRYEDQNERAGAELEIEATDEEAQHCERKDLDAGRNQARENISRVSGAFAEIRDRDQRPRDDEVRHCGRHHRENRERRRGDLHGMGQTQYRRRREKCEERQPGVERYPAPTVAAKVIDVHERQGAHRGCTQQRALRREDDEGGHADEQARRNRDPAGSPTGRCAVNATRIANRISSASGGDPSRASKISAAVTAALKMLTVNQASWRETATCSFDSRQSPVPP